MKEKIFDRMKRYGWTLYDDWNNIYNNHYDMLQDLYDFLHLLGDYENGYKNESDIDLNDIDQQKLTDMVDFMSDFVRAVNDIDKESEDNE